MGRSRYLLHDLIRSKYSHVCTMFLHDITDNKKLFIIRQRYIDYRQPKPTIANFPTTLNRLNFVEKVFLESLHGHWARFYFILFRKLQKLSLDEISKENTLTSQ